MLGNLSSDGVTIKNTGCSRTKKDTRRNTKMETRRKKLYCIGCQAGKSGPHLPVINQNGIERYTTGTNSSPESPSGSQNRKKSNPGPLDSSSPKKKKAENNKIDTLASSSFRVLRLTVVTNFSTNFRLTSTWWHWNCSWLQVLLVCWLLPAYFLHSIQCGEQLLLIYGTLSWSFRLFWHVVIHLLHLFLNLYMTLLGLISYCYYLDLIWSRSLMLILP